MFVAAVLALGVEVVSYPCFFCSQPGYNTASALKGSYQSPINNHHNPVCLLEISFLSDIQENQQTKTKMFLKASEKISRRKSYFKNPTESLLHVLLFPLSRRRRRDEVKKKKCSRWTNTWATGIICIFLPLTHLSIWKQLKAWIHPDSNLIGRPCFQDLEDWGGSG